MLASRSVEVNDNNANFYIGNVNDGNVNANDNNLCNSNSDNVNEDDNGAVPVRPVASTNCGYMNIIYVRDNVETVYVL